MKFQRSLSSLSPWSLLLSHILIASERSKKSIFVKILFFRQVNKLDIWKNQDMFREKVLSCQIFSWFSVFYVKNISFWILVCQICQQVNKLWCKNFQCKFCTIVCQQVNKLDGWKNKSILSSNFCLVNYFYDFLYVFRFWACQTSWGLEYQAEIVFLFQLINWFWLSSPFSSRVKKEISRHDLRVCWVFIKQLVWVLGKLFPKHPNQRWQ